METVDDNKFAWYFQIIEIQVKFVSEGLQRRELALGNWRNINNMHQANRENYGTDNNRNNFENRKDESSRDWNNSENNKK